MHAAVESTARRIGRARCGERDFAADSAPRVREGRESRIRLAAELARRGFSVFPAALRDEGRSTQTIEPRSMAIQVLFWFFAACAGGSALAMITRRNPVASAMWLIGTFFSLAAIYTLLGAYFIGIIQILVYAGAIMVLFLFVIMLLNLGNDLEADIRGTGWKIMAGGAGLVMVALLARVFAGDKPLPLGAEAAASSLAARQAQLGAVGVIAEPLYSDFVVPLQATAMLLLIAVVGAVVLAKRKV
jgi:NADH-quinone oxidoreductase subunit J